MRINSLQLIKFCCTRTNPAAETKSIGLQADARVGSVFCSPFIKCTMTSKNRIHYRDSYVSGLYRDQTTSVRLPGLAKNLPTLTQTATNQTAGPLAFMRDLSSRQFTYNMTVT